MGVRWASGRLAFLLAISAPLLLEGNVCSAAPACLVGDYSTGDFSQWPSVQTKQYSGSGKNYDPTYSASIVTDAERGDVARFEACFGPCAVVRWR